MTPVLTHSINSDMQQMLAFLWLLFLAGKAHLKASIVKLLLFSPGGLDPSIPLLPEVIRQEKNIWITSKEATFIQLQYLASVGYKNYLVGKWHLGNSKESFHPLKR